jgi:hypothetical protein
VQSEQEERARCFQNCTMEAQHLAELFKSGELISAMLPDSIEQGVVDSFKKLLAVKLPTGGKK